MKLKTKTLVCDVEANALFGYTEMWCVVTYCTETKELRQFKWRPDRGHHEEFKTYAEDATHWIGHNFISYDRHVVAKFTGLPLIPTSRITDTLVLSRLYNSIRDGGHSLERWGAYFGIHKVGKDIDDWSYFQPIMVERCVRDVAITRRLYEYLLVEGKNVSDTARNIESSFTEICDDIKTAGFPIDTELLREKHNRLKARKAELEKAIQAAFPPRPVAISLVSPRRKEDGSPYANTAGFKVLKDPIRTVWGDFTLFDWQEFNIGSPKQVVERMDEAGWKPVERTRSGKSWKVSETNLNTLPDTAPEEAKYIAEYLKLKTRLQLIDNWYDNLDLSTNLIHGSIISIGANTHRCAHHDPNTANIPSNDEWNIRDAWAVPEDGNRRLVGVDAKGIQLRILAHLLGDEDFKDQVVNGDPHMFNVRMIGSELLPQTTDEEKATARKKAKTFIYAWLLGAGYQKVGSIFGVDAKTGKAISTKYLENFTALKKLKEKLRRYASQGWLPLPDGRFIPVKSEHYVLACALQGNEQSIMKLAGILWKREAVKQNLDAWLIAFVHDEYVINSHTDCAQKAGDLMVWAIAEAGRLLQLRCPMEGDAPKIGFSWSEIH